MMFAVSDDLLGHTDADDDDDTDTPIDGEKTSLLEIEILISLPSLDPRLVPRGKNLGITLSYFTSLSFSPTIPTNFAMKIRS
jgi:hypothetical protein